MNSGWLRRYIPRGAILVILVFAAALWLVVREHGRITNEDRVAGLRSLARLIAARLDQPTGPAELEELLRSLQEEGITGVILGNDGAVKWNTTGMPVTPTLSAAPEVRQALASDAGWGAAQRGWGKAGRPHVMAAARARGGASTGSGVVWLTMPQWSIASRPGDFGRVLLHVALVVVLLSGVLILVYVRLRRRAVGSAVRAVRVMSAGDLGAPSDDRSVSEFPALSHALHGLRRRLAAHAETLDRHRRMFRLLVDELQEGVIVVGGDGLILLVNPAAMRLLGLPADQHRLVGQPAEACITDHQLQRLVHIDDLVGTRGGEVPAAVENTPGAGARVEIEGETGTRHLLARVADIVLAEAGERKTSSLRGRVLMLTDVTELQRSIQVRSDFVANASHELRTPLSTIRAAVETLLGMDLATEGPAARTFLEKIDRHSLRLQMMVSDLLELSRLETPSQHFAPETIDVRRLLHDLHLRFAEQLERKQLHWQARHEPPEFRTFEANPYLLRLALDNLVDNAVKFTDAGGTIAVELWASDAELRLTVRDTGCGIAEEEQQRVFERFYQVQRSRSGPDRGTGLGLSIVRHAVAVLRGTVELKSGLGRGTEITIIMPRANSSQAALNESQTQSSPKSNAAAVRESSRLPSKAG